ncbi:MAG: OapB/ArvB family protein [Candidatus Hodarchaeales archaeon]
MDLKIDFVTENTTRKMNSTEKCNFIISKLKNDRVIVFEGGLRPEEEAILIEEAMQHIDHESFIGYKIMNPAPKKTPGLFTRRDIKMTVIAPPNFERLSVALV